MKKIALSFILLITPLISDASTFEPKFYAEGQGELISQSDKDFQAKTQLIRLGSYGFYTASNFKVKYEVQAQFSDNFRQRDLDEIEVTHGRIILSSDYGSFVLGRSYSGIYDDIYRRVDIHPSNNGELASSNNMLWEQATYAKNVFAYGTPRLDLGSGTLRLITSITTPNENNGVDNDVTTGRIVYTSELLNLSAGITVIDKEMAPEKAYATENYSRYSFGADTKLENLTIAILAELTDNPFYVKNGFQSAANKTYVGALKYQLNDIKFGASYQYKTYEGNWGGESQSLIVGSINYKYSDALSFFIEGALYNEKPINYNDNYSGDSLSVGFRVNL
ncbi:hypothetical protein KO537_21100 [Shewanella sp. NKUCC01_JLK]|uniref:hypothetical protein n=1 Tax=Shewanella sp. NKUCC01_JLK TaxID=2842123 RepID=UPI001C5B758F|nr:hypothetical protein [Shewanella sp. NKUCC01_JLK]MBW3517189.1 hypothetical protein [Shewanella sp. NKUCC01_JLK]